MVFEPRTVQPVASHYKPSSLIYSHYRFLIIQNPFIRLCNEIQCHKIELNNGIYCHPKVAEGYQPGICVLYVS
jgi:hypothetical protein